MSEELSTGVDLKLPAVRKISHHRCAWAGEAEGRVGPLMEEIQFLRRWEVIPQCQIQIRSGNQHT